MKAILVTLALLCAVAQGAWAWNGSGTSADPYLIKTSADWRQLAADVKGGNSFSGKYFRLTADINVSTGGQGVSVGTADKPFSGTFDGFSHSMTYNVGSSMTGKTGYCAPFVLLKGATIRNLDVKGTVHSNGEHTGGIASMVDGSAPTSIENCRVFTVFDLNRDGFGGFVGKVLDTCTATLKFTDCSFFGQISYSNGENNGGFVGYSPVAVSMRHCLFDPAGTPDGSTNATNATFARVAANAALTLDDCAYTKLFGKAQGQYVFTEVSVPEGCTAEMVGEPKLSRNNRKYYASGAQVLFTVPEGTPFDHWVSGGAPGCFVSDP